MFTLINNDTGIISLILYGIFVVIAFVGLLFCIISLRAGAISIKRLTTVIDLFKYVIVTVAISTVILIVSNLFKKKEQDIKELEYFGKYVENIKKTANITERYEISRCFSTVSPDGPLKDSWIKYYKSVKNEYQIYLKNKPLEDSLSALSNLTTKQRQALNRAKSNIKEKDRPILSQAVSGSSGIAKVVPNVTREKNNIQDGKGTLKVIIEMNQGR